MLTYGCFRLVTFVLFAVSACLHVAAFSTAFWFKRKDIHGWLVHHGLWLLCDDYKPLARDSECLKLANRQDSLQNGQLRSVQALMSISLAANTVAIFVFLSWITCKKSQNGADRTKRVGLAGFVLCIMSGILTTTAVTIFGVYYAKFEDVLNWSYVLATVSGGTLLLGGTAGLILLLIAPFHKTLPKLGSASRQPPLPTMTSMELGSGPPVKGEDASGCGGSEKHSPGFTSCRVACEDAAV